MKIAMISALAETVPPQKYGGTELVVYNITQTLIKMGHAVTLFAPSGSKTDAQIVPTLPKSLRSMALPNANFENAMKITEVGKIAFQLTNNKFDIVHNHIGWRLLSLEKLISAPIITTLHGPLNDPYQNFVYKMYGKSNYASISLNQRLPLPELNFVANVYNGLDLARFRFFEKPKGDYVIFLSRMSPEKGPLQAIQAVKAAGVKLILAAKVDPVDKKFFEQEVAPLIDGKQIQFIGELDHEAKIELLGNARGLLGLIQWEEPFGLFFAEAMACGTPVIATNRGSVPEIVKDGETGFICKTPEEVVAAIKNIDKISRRACFDHVAQNFSADKMTQGYLKAYEKVIKAAGQK